MIKKEISVIVWTGTNYTFQQEICCEENKIYCQTIESVSNSTYLMFV